VANHFGVGGGFFEGGNEELGGFHRVRLIQAGASGKHPTDSFVTPCIMDTIKKFEVDYA
jgi:hypothetical protein